MVTGGQFAAGIVVAFLLGFGFASVANAPARKPDDKAAQEVFGRTYDECLLKNATKGGDADTRQTATVVCDRHFIRPATTDEIGSVAVTSFIEKDDQGEHLLIHLQNNNRYAEIRHAQVNVLFGTDATGLTWSQDVDVLPGATGDFSGSFTDNKAPGKITSQSGTGFDVLSQTGASG